jgi:excisionase family DNA binding protein
MSSSLEIRPGSVEARELAVIERALARDGEVAARLVDAHGDSVDVPTELLNVSRPHLIKFLEGGVLPFRMVGTRRRLRLVDVLAHRDCQDELRRVSESGDWDLWRDGIWEEGCGATRRVLSPPPKIARSGSFPRR